MLKASPLKLHGSRIPVNLRCRNPLPFVQRPKPSCTPRTLNGFVVTGEGL